MLNALAAFDRRKLRKTSTTVRDVEGRVKIERSGIPTEPQVDARGDARAPPPVVQDEAAAVVPIRSVQRSRLQDRKRAKVSRVVSLVRQWGAAPETRGEGIEALARLVATGANIHEREPGFAERMAIHWSASRVAPLAVLRYLIEQGGFVGAKDARGFTPLHIASLRGIASGGAEALQLLIDAHASPNSVTDNGRSPLRDACIRGGAETVAILVGSGASIRRCAVGVDPIPATLADALRFGCAVRREATATVADADAVAAIEATLRSAAT